MLNHSDLIAKLKNSHQKFLNHIDALTKEEFELSNNQKWTAGQELEHIVKSTLPIAKVLRDKAFIKSKFGTIDRTSLEYQGLVDKYHTALGNGGKAFGPFIPEKVGWESKSELKNQLIEIVENISKNLDLYNEDELKTLVIPHPLLGALTIQEMMFFTIYHVRHHLGNSLKNLGK